MDGQDEQDLEISDFKSFILPILSIPVNYSYITHTRSLPLAVL
jgi:hypothetical protein